MDPIQSKEGNVMMWLNLAFLVFNMMYLIAVIRSVGIRYDRDFDLWTRRMRRATISKSFIQTGTNVS